MNDQLLPKFQLSGPVGLRDVAAIRRTLLDAIETGAAVDIDATDVTDIDVSVIQLLISAKRSAMRRHVDLRISAPADGCLAQALSRGGFSGMLGPVAQLPSM